MKVLISAPYIIPVLDRFQSIFDQFGLEIIIEQVRERLDEDGILRHAGTFNGTICGDDIYSAPVLEACTPQLKVISKWGTGIDSIDQEAAARVGVKVYRTPNAFTQPVADTVMGYILAFVRRQPWMDRDMKNGVWDKLPGRSLSECTLGIIGVGNIGKAVVRRAHSFGMQLLGTDIVEIDPDFILKFGLEMISLNELLKRSDFISLNCDLNPTSYHLINAERLKMIKPSAVLVNTSRGLVIDEPDLIAALQIGSIAGAALDVFEDEPLPLDNPLRQMDNVMLAPHNANSSPKAWEYVHRNTIHNLLIGLGFDPPLTNIVNSDSQGKIRNE